MAAATYKMDTRTKRVLSSVVRDEPEAFGNGILL